MTGTSDNLLRVAVPDTANYKRIHTDVLSCLPSVARLQPRLRSVQVDGSEVLTADANIAAMGSYTPRLVKRIGIHLPIYPLMGYRRSCPSSMPLLRQSRPSWTRLTRSGPHASATGFGSAELAGFSQRLRAPRRATLEHSVTDLFPQGGNVKQASFWTGLRPMTPTTRRWWAQSGTGTCTPTPVMAPSAGTWPVAQDGL